MASRDSVPVKKTVVIERQYPGMFVYAGGVTKPLWTREVVTEAEAQVIERRLMEVRFRVAYSSEPTVRIVGRLKT